MKTLKLPKKLESSVERSFVRRAEALVCRTRKLNGLGNRDWPDRLVLGPNEFFAFYEFKRPGKALRPTQEALRNDLAELGHQVHVFDDADAAVAHLKASLKAHMGVARKVK